MGSVLRFAARSVPVDIIRDGSNSYRMRQLASDCRSLHCGLFRGGNRDSNPLGDATSQHRYRGVSPIVRAGIHDTVSVVLIATGGAAA